MNRQIRLLIALILGICGSILALSLSVAPSKAIPVSARRLSPMEAAPCPFTAVTVTASPNARFRISDTLPGGAISRTIYFANHQSGIITISTTISDSCVAWGGAAFGRTEPAVLEPGKVANQRWLTYPVDIDHGSTTVVLTSSLTTTGTVLAPSHRVALTFTQDIQSPYDVVIVSPPYTTDTEFPVSWEADDAGSGIAFFNVIYSSTIYTTWQEWLVNTTIRSGTFAAPERGVDYIFRAVAFDHVGNYTASQGAKTHVAYFRVYVPLILRHDRPPLPTVSMDIEGGASTTFRVPVILTLSVTGKGDEVTEMRLRNEDTDWTEDDWEPFSSTKAWTLVSGNSGLRTVYAQFRGKQGGVSDPISDQIYLSLNGGFEDGYVQTAWQEIEDPIPMDIVPSIVEKSGGSTLPAEGSYALLLGDPDYPWNGVPLGYAAAEQMFRLPPNAEKLVFNYIIWSQDACLGNTYDRFEVYISSTLTFADGNQILKPLDWDLWRRVPGPENPRAGQTSGWATGEIDLSPYAGQDVVISFRNYNRGDGYYNTYTHVDRVTVEGGW